MSGIGVAAAPGEAGPGQMASGAAWRQVDGLPIGLFGSVMGLTGLSVAWRLAQDRLGAPAWVADVVGALAVLAFVAVAAGYAVKAAIAPRSVRAEFRHPIAASLFGTVLISLLLLPIVLASAAGAVPGVLGLARGMWAVGAAGMVLFAWLIVSRWMSDRQQAAHATPAWFIPVVGLLDVPLALPALGWSGADGAHGVMAAGLALGLFFALPLFTLVFSRLLFEAPLPDALQPSLLILVAPFSVGFSTYVEVSGSVDLFAQSLYAVMLFLLAVLLGRLRHLPRCCPFRVSWWAVSFPLAASAIAALRFARAWPGWASDAVALGLLALATAAIAGLLGRTLLGMARGELRTLSL